jgi:sugar/nucleoside kinase (ribokinase family)
MRRVVPELDLLVLGDINPDVIVSDPDLHPEFGQVEQLVDRAAMVLAGSAAITAVGAARMGLSVGICGVVGDDDLGRLMLACLTDAEVDVTQVRIDAHLPTGVSVILDRGDDRAILTAPGTISALVPDDLDKLGRTPARHVHAASYYLMGEIYRESLPAFLSDWKEHGVGTSIDSNWDPQRRWDLRATLRHCDLFLPNEAELAGVAGSPIVDRALDVVAELGCDVAVKRGQNGGVARVAGHTYRVARTPTVEFVDSIGAGDSFNAGFIAGRLSGYDGGKCLAMAVAAGSLSTAAPGGTAGQPGLQDVTVWADRLPVNEVAP